MRRLFTGTNRGLFRSCNVRVLGVCLGLMGVGLSLGCEPSGDGELAVLDIEPRAGASQGEQPVRITGANFRQDIGYTVYFGAKRAAQVTIMDDTTLLVTTPSHESGSVDVVVAADSGPAFRIVSGFTYADQGGNVIQQMGETTGRPGERY